MVAINAHVPDALVPDSAIEQGRLVERCKGKGTKLCVAVGIEQKQTIMHYQPVKKRQFLKIVLATPTMVTQARGDVCVSTDQLTDMSHLLAVLQLLLACNLLATCLQLASALIWVMRVMHVSSAKCINARHVHIPQ